MRRQRAKLPEQRRRHSHRSRHWSGLAEGPGREEDVRRGGRRRQVVPARGQERLAAADDQGAVLTDRLPRVQHADSRAIWFVPQHGLLPLQLWRCADGRASHRRPVLDEHHAPGALHLRCRSLRLLRRGVWVHGATGSPQAQAGRPWSGRAAERPKGGRSRPVPHRPRSARRRDPYLQLRPLRPRRHRQAQVRGAEERPLEVPAQRRHTAREQRCCVRTAAWSSRPRRLRATP